MRFDVRKITGLSLILGLLLVGSATAPATAAPELEPRPLVQEVEGLDGPDGMVLSADNTTLYVFNSWGANSVVDVKSRLVVGAFDSIPELSYSESTPRQAVGPRFAVMTHGGYTLLTLATGAQERFHLKPPAGAMYVPELSHVFVDETGTVTAVSQAGEFLSIEGDTITEVTPLAEAEGWAYPTTTSTDGAKYFELRSDVVAPYGSYALVIDMRTGELLRTFDQSDPNPFTPLAFDESGTSIWGTFAEDDQTLANVDIVTGAVLETTRAADNHGGVLLASSAEDWFTMSGGPAVGGSLGAGAEFGGRELGCCTTAMVRLPSGGDVIYYDVEMRRVGFITAPTISNPVDVAIAALGETAVFTSHAEGLALSEQEAGVDPLSPLGSIWQSSPDGTTWTDIADETGATLSVAATVENYQLEYRRHFLDPYWGPAPSSASARMTGLHPKITRPDDLPDGTATQNYPGQFITATGQPGMTWSSTDLPQALTLDTGTGEISGTTDSVGDYSFTVTVTDVFGTDSRLYNLHVAQGTGVPPGPTPDPDPNESAVPPKTPALPETGSPGWLLATVVAAALLATGTVGLLARRRSSANN